MGLGERSKLPQQGLGQSPNHKCILDVLRVQKTHPVAVECLLVPVSRFALAEPLDTIGRTLKFQGTLVEKH